MKTITLFDLVNELTELGKQIEKLGYRTDKARTIPLMQESVDGKLYPIESKEFKLVTIDGVLTAVMKNKKQAKEL